jgi:hypothetical protein
VLKKKIQANFQRIIELFTKKIVKKLLKYGLGIRDPRSGIRDPGSGKNLFRIPDPGVKKHPIRIRNTGIWHKKNFGLKILKIFVYRSSVSVPNPESGSLMTPVPRIRDGKKSGSRIRYKYP